MKAQAPDLPWHITHEKIKSDARDANSDATMYNKKHQDRNQNQNRGGFKKVNNQNNQNNRDKPKGKVCFDYNLGS